MRIVFMGTPDLSATVLERLAQAFEVVGAYTRPDAVRGRGKKLVASPVKTTAEKLGIPVYTPSTLRDEKVQEELSSLEPDAICVAAYGAILPPEVLAIPTLGCFNVHTSLLPRWRGAAPMQRAILERDEQAGVCIMRMEKGLDTGPYCKRVTVPLDDLYLSQLENTLAHEGAEALVDALKEADAGTISWLEQDDANITYAAKIEKGELDPNPAEIADLFCAKVRASSPAHPAHTEVAGKGLTVVRARKVTDERTRELVADLTPGQAALRAKKLLIMAADAPVELEEVKPDGKNNMDARSFAAGIQGIKNTIITWGKE